MTTSNIVTPKSAKDLLVRAWVAEVELARQARRRRDDATTWAHLERAHILSQPLAGRHVRTHLAMLRFGVCRRNRREVVGQLLRIVVAAPGSWSGRYPIGNTGRADVSAFEVMPIPADLQFLLSPNIPLWGI